MELHEQADLLIRSGCTYLEVAERLQVTESQLTEWSREELIPRSWAAVANDPTPEEIVERAREIRDEWSDTEYANRSRHFAPKPVEVAVVQAPRFDHRMHSRGR